MATSCWFRTIYSWQILSTSWQNPDKTTTSSSQNHQHYNARVNCLFWQFRLLYTILTAHANDRDIQYPYHWNHWKQRSHLETRRTCLYLVFFSSSDWVLSANKVCITWVNTFHDRLQLSNLVILKLASARANFDLHPCSNLKVRKKWS